MSLLLWKKRRIHLLPNTSFLTILAPILHTCICFLIIYLLGHASIPASPILLFFISLGFFVATMADFILLKILLDGATKQEILLQMDLTKRQIEQNRNYYESVKEHIFEIQDLQREFSEKLQSAYYMAQNRDVVSNKQALEVLNALKRRVNQTTPFYFCKPPIINVILKEYYKETEQLKIIFKINIRDIDHIFIEKSDIYTIFSFLLSDAVQAARQCKNEPLISISTYQKANFFIIKEKHSITSIPSKEQELSLHHKMLFISIAKKYHGFFQTNVTDFFITTFIVPFPE